MTSLSNSSVLDIAIFINLNIFPHLKLGIVLAFPGSDEWEIETDNSLLARVCAVNNCLIKTVQSCSLCGVLSLKSV